MSRRANQSPEARERERIANRLRMRRVMADPERRARANARRKERDRQRKQDDPSLRPRLSANSKRYYESRKGDAAFWSKRKEYLRRWRQERFLDEEFEAFMQRIEGEAHAAQ